MFVKIQKEMINQIDKQLLEVYKRLHQVETMMGTIPSDDYGTNLPARA